MTLAGSMRLKTFAAFALPLLAAIVLAGGFFVRGQMREHAAQQAIERARVEEEIRVERAAQEVAAEERRIAGEKGAEERRLAAEAKALARTERAKAIAHLREHERTLLLDWAGTDLRSPKRKDVSEGKPYKINVYQDAGQRTVNRAKVDLDRDGPEATWDEKWTFGPDGAITRQRSTKDDGTYDVQETFDGTNFVAN